MLELDPNQIPADLMEFFEPRWKDGAWIQRNEVIWHKPAAMPSSATDRFTVDFEKIFFLQNRKSIILSSKPNRFQKAQSGAG